MAIHAETRLNNGMVIWRVELAPGSEEILQWKEDKPVAKVLISSKDTLLLTKLGVVPTEHFSLSYDGINRQNLQYAQSVLAYLADITTQIHWSPDSRVNAEASKVMSVV